VCDAKFAHATQNCKASNWLKMVSTSAFDLVIATRSWCYWGSCWPPLQSHGRNWQNWWLYGGVTVWEDSIDSHVIGYYRVRVILHTCITMFFIIWI